METTVINIVGMTCEGCVNSVRKALLQIDGVVEVTVTLTPPQASIRHDVAHVERARLQTAIEEAGYETH